MNKHQIADYFKSLQDRICASIAEADGKSTFHEDAWEHHAGGGGRTRLIQEGGIIEKGGVNFSAVEGTLHPRLRQQLQLPEDQELTFFATGVSIVMHPRSPRVPIIHMNVRYFELENGTCWFGGGIDLTPHYVVASDAIFFHSVLKDVCDQTHPAFYDRFKHWADDYFYLLHRNETRGIGGIFFDYLKPDLPITLEKGTAQLSKEVLFAFVQRVGEAFAPIYTRLMKAHAQESYTEAEKKWQMLRRGRYVEFNLVWDRGTKFGLETNGRTESILMSLPPVAHWAYDYTPEADTPEADTLAYLRKGVNWIEMEA